MDALAFVFALGMMTISPDTGMPGPVPAARDQSAPALEYAPALERAPSKPNPSFEQRRERILMANRAWRELRLARMERHESRPAERIVLAGEPETRSP